MKRIRLGDGALEVPEIGLFSLISGSCKTLDCLTLTIHPLEQEMERGAHSASAPEGRENMIWRQRRQEQ